MWIPITPRNCITAHHGQVIVSIDYSGEEARIAAVLSGDRNMLGVFRQPSTIMFEGKEYNNYYADLHAITAKECVLSKPFEGRPEHLWMSISKDEKNWPGKGSIRDVGKTVNFGIIYGAGAGAISEQANIPLIEAELIHKAHKKTYPEFHSWSAENGEICQTTGFSKNAFGRLRFVNESNSKGVESPSVIGVNNLIQSAGSDIIKRAGTKVRKYLRQSNSNMYIINCSHDEIVMLGEGYCVPTVIWKDEENEIVDKIKWKCISEDIIKHSAKVQQIMEDVEATVLKGVLDAKAEVSIAPYWSK